MPKSRRPARFAAPTDADRLRPTSIRRAVAESTAVAARRTVRETPTVIEAPRSGNGRILVQLIRAGWSVNGNYYPAAVLKRDGAAAWPAGTLNYVDHDTDAEEEARPAGSLMRLASYQTTEARWDEDRQALVAEVATFSMWREHVTEWARSGAIGMSIRAWVTGDNGEAEGRTGFIVESIPQGRSVDYVTVPAAGGALLSVLESAHGRRQAAAEARNVGAWLESRLHLALTQLGDDMYGDGRLTRDERITLSSAIGEALTAWTARVQADAPQLFERDLWTYPEPAATAAEEARRAAEATTDETRSALHRVLSAAHGGDRTYVWVRDFDPDRQVVWFDVSDGDGARTWQQDYTAGDSGPALTGERVEVTARTVYDPVPGDSDADQAGTEESADQPAPAATPASEDVTGGDPPAGPNPTEEEPAMSGANTGVPPEQPGTVPGDGQPPTIPPTPQTPPTDPTPPAPAPDPARPQTDPAVTEALSAITNQLAAMQGRLDQRDADNRRLRNEATARDQVTAALSAAEHADVRDAITSRVTESVLRGIPVTDAGDVDAVRLGDVIASTIAAEATFVRTDRARVLEAAGVGRPYGLGVSEAPQANTVEAFEAELAGVFQAAGMGADTAKIAAQGRG